MAANQAQTGGYDYKWAEDSAEDADDLKCLICLSVAKDPQQHGGKNGCGKIFCNSCIKVHLRTSRTCPNCREQLRLFQDKRCVSKINALKMKCDNLKKGCEWVGELSNLNAHLNTCDYVRLPCDNNCTNNGQTVIVLRKDKQDHLTNHCPKRQYKCPHCEEIGEHQEMTGTHLEACPQLKIHCPNTPFCKATIPRCEILVHGSTCHYERVPCKYAAVGCKEKILRKKLTEHEENDQLHLRMTTVQVLKLTKKTIKLQAQISVERSARLTSVGCKPQLTFRMDRFEENKNDRNIFHSSSFYTSRKGYKFRIRVDAGGNGSGEGTHVSIFACLMKGDHDDALTWPFPGDVTFELLNHIEDENHYRFTTQFLNNEESQRVVENEGEHVLGKTTFIEYRNLEYNPDKNCQYLEDDALIFRVSVRPHSYKPWLQCTHA